LKEIDFNQSLFKALLIIKKEIIVRNSTKKKKEYTQELHKTVIFPYLCTKKNIAICENSTFFYFSALPP
jgi:hypothetical protein